MAKGKPRGQKVDIYFFTIICILIVFTNLFTLHTNLQYKQLKETINSSKRLPEAFGGVGYISSINGNTITVVGYGKFLVSNNELNSLSVGEECPQYILKRGS